MSDWVGTKASVFKTLGASSHCDEERESNDFYATDPSAVEALLNIKPEIFDKSITIWEPCCGLKHISNKLLEHGYTVMNTDLINRDGATVVYDFLSDVPCNAFYHRFNIITNPPYKYAKEFVEKALNRIDDGYKVAMFLKLTFLEGQERRKLFDIYPPKVIYVFSKRQECAKNGDFGKGSAVAYAWFIWEKGYKADPIIKWI